MSYTIKISFKGISRDVQLSAPVTVRDLQATAASAFELNEGTFRFTYRDSEGDDITIAIDSELALALRLCKGVLALNASLAEAPQRVLEVRQSNRKRTSPQLQVPI